MKTFLTHAAAFIAGILAVTAFGLVVCETVENIDTENPND